MWPVKNVIFPQSLVALMVVGVRGPLNMGHTLGGAHLFMSAALSFSDSKNVCIMCSVDRLSFPVAADRDQVPRL